MRGRVLFSTEQLEPSPKVGRVPTAAKRNRNSERKAGVATLRLEFVVRPGAMHEARAALEQRFCESQGSEDGFVTGLLLVSDQEARLVTLLTFWRAGWLERDRERRTRWLQRILEPYLDRWLRVQTDSAYPLEGPRNKKLGGETGIPAEGATPAREQSAACEVSVK